MIPSSRGNDSLFQRFMDIYATDTSGIFIYFIHVALTYKILCPFVFVYVSFSMSLISSQSNAKTNEDFLKCLTANFAANTKILTLF